MPLQAAMTEAEYWQEYELASEEVEAAIQLFYTSLDIHACAAESELVYRMLNRQAAFWNLQLHGLQASFFVTLGRVFDNGTDCHSVHRLLRATVAHPEFFTKQALGRRKAPGHVKPEWLDTVLAAAYEPQISDLRHLKKAVTPCQTKYRLLCKDIRDKVFAHKIVSDSVAASDLFSKAQISEIDDLLYSLHDLMKVIWHMLMNGMKPELSITTYDYRERIKKTTEDALRTLASDRPAEA